MHNQDIASCVFKCIMRFTRFSYHTLWNIYETIIRIFNYWTIIHVKNALDFEKDIFHFLFQESNIEPKEMCKISATSF